MRRALLLAVLLPPLSLLAAAEGCQDATQVTVEIGLPLATPCTDITSTSITVGSEQRAVEARVATGDITTKTSQCDPATRKIGTLVLTPGESERGALVVVVGYKGVDSSQCKPPAYDGCIVVRRRFSFSTHAGLLMPITVDPLCAGVACDESTTCRAGACFTSEIAVASCAGGVCEQPGELPGGGTNEAGAVIPEGGVGSIVDAASDGNTGGHTPPAGGAGATCAGALHDTLTCPTDPSSPGIDCPKCCNVGGTPQCTADQACGTTTVNYCCQSTDCLSGKCDRSTATVNGAGTCILDRSLTCTPDGKRINCPDAPCAAGTTCCVADPQNPVCASNCGGDSTCCSDADCNGGPCTPVAQSGGTVRYVCSGI